LHCRRSAVATLVFLCFLACTGCSGSIQRPTARVAGMNLGAANERGFTMNFDVAIDNPNAVALPLRAADYKLQLGGVDVIDGKAKPEGSVPARGSQTVTVPVNLTYQNLLASEQGIAAGGGDVPFGFDGGLSFSTGALGGTWLGLDTVRVPLKYSGTLHLRQLLTDPQILLKSPAARQLAQRVIGSGLHLP
jgi:LEA14-like dessication related protein